MGEIGKQEGNALPRLNTVQPQGQGKPLALPSQVAIGDTLPLKEQGWSLGMLLSRHKEAGSKGARGARCCWGHAVPLQVAPGSNPGATSELYREANPCKLCAQDFLIELSHAGLGDSFQEEHFIGQPPFGNAG